MNHTRTFSPLISAGSLSEPPLPPLLLPHAASPRARAAPPPSMLRLLHVDVIVLSSRFLRGRPACDGRRGLVTDPGSARSLGRGPPRVNFSDRFEMLTSGSRESFPIEPRAHPDASEGGAPDDKPVTHVDIRCVTLVSWRPVGAAASVPADPLLLDEENHENHTQSLRRAGRRRPAGGHGPRGPRRRPGRAGRRCCGHHLPDRLLGGGNGGRLGGFPLHEPRAGLRPRARA